MSAIPPARCEPDDISPPYRRCELKLKTMRSGILALCLLVIPHASLAQTVPFADNGFVSINGGGQFASHSLDFSSSFDLYGETATINAATKIKNSGLFDIGGAYRVWGKNLLAGAFFSHAASKSNVTVNASIPDPAIFGQFRNVTTSAGDLKHSENALHLDAIWMLSLTEQIDLGVFAGPTIFFVKQDTISALNVSEPGPTVTPQVKSVSKTTGGINLGVDGQYLIPMKIAVGKIAVGATARYTWGSTKIAGASKDLTLGGFQLAGGLRYRF
jgi:hypothetical protein